MIRKTGKRLVLVLGVVIAGLLLLLIIGGALLPKDRIKDDLARRLSTATGAQVELGKARIKWLPSLAVALDGGSISGTGPQLARATGSENKLHEFQVDLSRLDIQVELRPLLNREVEVASIDLAGPRLHATWEGGQVTVLDYALVLSHVSLPLAEVRAGQTGTSGGGPGSFLPEELGFDFRGKATQMDLRKGGYRDLNFSGDLDALIVTIEELTTSLGGGQILASGEIDYERDPFGELDFAAQVQQVPAGALLEPWAPEIGKRLTGNLDGEVSGTCNLKDQPTRLATLSLNGELFCEDGVLAAADWLHEATPYLGNRQDLKNIEFHRLDHAFRVDEGRYEIEDLVIDGRETDWTIDGWVGLNGTMDTELKVKLPPGFTPELGQWSFLASSLRDADGRINLGFTLSGPTDKPRFGLDLGALGGQGQPGANDALKKGLGGLLDKWKNR